MRVYNVDVSVPIEEKLICYNASCMYGYVAHVAMHTLQTDNDLRVCTS